MKSKTEQPLFFQILHHSVPEILSQDSSITKTQLIFKLWNLLQLDCVVQYNLICSDLRFTLCLKLDPRSVVVGFSQP